MKSRLLVENSHDAIRTRRLWMATILGALSAIGPLSIDMYLPSLPIITNDLETSTAFTQLSLTACLLGLALGQLLAGPISDLHGRRLPLIVGLALYSLTSLLCALDPSIETLIFLRFVQGLAGSAGIVVSRAIVRDLYSGLELTKFFALLMLINGAAPILAPIFGGQLLHFTTWRGVFVVLALLGLAMLLAVLFGLPETLSAQDRTRGGVREIISAFGRLMTDQAFMGYALAQACVFAGMFAYIAGSPFVLQNIYAVSPQGFSFIFALNGIGIIIASQMTGRLAGRVSEQKLLLFGLGLATVGGLLLLILIIMKAHLIGIMIPLFFVVSSVGIVATTSFALAMQNQGQVSGSAASILGVLPLIAGALVAPLVGLAGSYTALPMAMVIVMAEIGAVLSYFLLVKPNEL